MTAAARLRGKAASSLARRGPRGRGRQDADEEATAILEHLELGDSEVAASAASAGRPGARGARRVHLAVLPERYEPLEEPAPRDKPKRRYRQRLKKYGKVGDPPPPATAPRGREARTPALGFLRHPRGTQAGPHRPTCSPSLGRSCVPLSPSPTPSPELSRL
ncbi:uncharacterized protein C1orf115-like [Pteropus medius]|uniref:uncharacterized protein C1orf115-like n=1 Tax=Pteropus vampyrus TaxID=132908 RepID=UPI00196A8EA6|nr:uncharacterized protein C1orf115-like [Pteropus giganteus]